MRRKARRKPPPSPRRKNQRNVSLAEFIHRRSRLEIAFLALAALWILISLTHTAAGFAALIGLVEFVLGAILLYRLIRYLARQSIWRLRNRLMVTYLFIGVVPVVLIAILVVAGGYIVAGQVAMFMVTSELDRRIDALNEPAQILGWSSPETEERVVNQVTPFIRIRFPRIEMLVHGDHDVRYPGDSNIVTPPAGWPESRGLVLKQGHFFQWSHVVRNQTEVVMLSPVTSRMLSELVPNLAQVFLGDDRGVPLRGDPTVDIPPQADFFDREVMWVSDMDVADWELPGKIRHKDTLVVITRPSALLSAIFSDRLKIGQDILFIFYGIAGLFLFVELVSLFAGLSLSRSITGAVHNLYQGTQRVTAGDFSHRIHVAGQDQLAALSASFNGMTENLERLFAVEKEKERLQSELEIAKEVQAQLFPKDIPSLKSLQLTGVCMPARLVSGDYYDYFCINDTKVAVALGDVAGKGISAALLRAAIQSIMHSQLNQSEGATSMDTSRVVSLLNRQVYANTAPEKYATFFFGIYDESDRMLSYTNAGHLQPLLVRSGSVELLEVTGTVVGLFAKAPYEERTIALRPGDLLVAYTDGIAEPENEYGEQFGEERLTALLLKNAHLETKEIISRVMEAVVQWSSDPELPDDMTMLIAKVS